MAVTVMLEWPGMTMENYQGIMEALGLETDPSEVLLHSASVTPDGIRVVDIWQSAEHWERFLEDRIMPIVTQAGIDTRPTVQFYDTANVYTPRINQLADLGRSPLPPT